jgi:hypothetical protein
MNRSSVRFRQAAPSKTAGHRLAGYEQWMITRSTCLRCARFMPDQSDWRSGLRAINASSLTASAMVR